MRSRKKSSSTTTIELTQRTLSDLLDIERYSVKEWGRRVADKYLDDIAAALDRLKENVDLLRIEQDLATGLYVYRVNRHYLVCDLQVNAIIVLTVVHTSMDLPSRLLELQPHLLTESQILQSKLRRARREAVD